MKHSPLLIILILLIPVLVYFFFPQELSLKERQTITPAPLSCLSTAECSGASCDDDLGLCVKEPTCELVQGTGNADNIDLLFITDEYTRKEAIEAVTIIIGQKEYQGLYNTPPFKGTEPLHNIWLTSANTTTRNLPTRASSLIANAECPSADKTITLSKKTFRSYCYYSGDCYLSIGKYTKEYWGKLFLHEYGHGFGGLADEYEEPTLGDRSRYPNCAPDEKTAKEWTSMTPIPGCSYVENNYRFTNNSIMRQHLTQQRYGEVSEKHIATIIEKYKNTRATTGDYGLVTIHLAAREEGTEAITLTPLGIKKGALPQFQEGNNTATLSDGNSTLFTARFLLTTQHDYEAPPAFFDENGTQLLNRGEQYTFTTAYALIITPYDTRATQLTITDDKGIIRAIENLTSLNQCNNECEAGETCASDCAVNYCSPPTLSITKLLQQGTTHLTFDDEGTLLEEREGFITETTLPS